MENESKLRILLIEDAAPEQRAFQSYAQSQPDVEGIWCADCVEEGLRLLQEQTPNFVVLDWMLKGEGGDRFLERIRELEGSRPCIFVASNITSEYTKAKAGNTGLIENYYEKTAAGYGFGGGRPPERRGAAEADPEYPEAVRAEHQHHLVHFLSGNHVPGGAALSGEGAELRRDAGKGYLSPGRGGDLGKQPAEESDCGGEAPGICDPAELANDHPDVV